jgi:hypothetical protein
MVPGLKQPLSEVLLSGTESFVDTALNHFTNILNFVYVWAVSWPFPHVDLVTVEMIYHSLFT